MPESQPLACLEVEGTDLARPVLAVPAPGEDHHLPSVVTNSKIRPNTEYIWVLKMY